VNPIDYFKCNNFIAGLSQSKIHMKYRLLICVLLVSGLCQAQMKVTYLDKIGPFPDPPPQKAAIPQPPTYSNDLKPVATLAEVGISNPLTILKADEAIERAIAAKAFPGCRVLAAKNGKVFYDKAFGFQTYDQSVPVSMNTVYDLASLTKIVSTTLAVMRLYEQGKIVLDKTLGDYLPNTLGTDKAALPLRALMLHQAGLKAWIPFYKSYIDSSGHLRDSLFHTKPDAHYNVEVAQDLYMRKENRDTIWHTILMSPLENAGRYVYSDLDYYFLAAVVEKVSGKSINRYITEQFYNPMGLKMIGYLPLQFIKKDLIAPTENDQVFRHQLLRGYVHDPGAALFGGVAGHAGVFGTAGDVAALFQMLLNEGKYGGKTYFKPETIQYFTAYSSFISRRGLGFDKPDADRKEAGPTSTRCSGYTFGHQGFTGTCAWADPENGIIFIFLSNRVYPDQDNKKIQTMGTRTDVQDILYEALGLPENTGRPEVKQGQLNKH